MAKTTKKAPPKKKPSNKADSKAAISIDPPESDGMWRLRLYVAGQSPKSLTAFANLKRLCEQHLAGKYTIEVIDLVANPDLAAKDGIMAVPTLVRKVPSPLRKILGNLSDEERFLISFDIKSPPAA